jgi:hypothetical protein
MGLRSRARWSIRSAVQHRKRGGRRSGAWRADRPPALLAAVVDPIVEPSYSPKHYGSQLDGHAGFSATRPPERAPHSPHAVAKRRAPPGVHGGRPAGTRALGISKTAAGMDSRLVAGPAYWRRRAALSRVVSPTLAGYSRCVAPDIRPNRQRAALRTGMNGFAAGP